jgi:thiamine kinase-like enzyme
LLVVEWVDGRTFTDGDLRIGGNLPRVAEACRRLHAGPRFVNDFDLFDVAQGYLRIVFERGFRLPPGYLGFADQVEQMRAALAVRPEPAVPCHNDLLAANIMDDGRRIWFIDYEYAGNNDPCFELGNLISEADLPVDALVELVDAYYGGHSPARIARAQLYSVMSNYGWVLWASIQDATSPIDFDFWSWGLAKYDRAVRAFARPEFGTLLNEVQQSG